MNTVAATKTNTLQYEILQNTFLLREKCYYTTLQYFPLCISIDNKPCDLSLVPSSSKSTHDFDMDQLTCSHCEKVVGKMERLFMRSAHESKHFITCFTCYTVWESSHMVFIIIALEILTQGNGDVKSLLKHDIYSFLKEKLVFNLSYTRLSLGFEDLFDASFGVIGFISDVNQFYRLLRRFPSYPLPNMIHVTTKFVTFNWIIDDIKAIKLVIFSNDWKAYISDYNPSLSSSSSWSNASQYAVTWFDNQEAALNSMYCNPNWFKGCGFMEKLDRTICSMLKSVK
jgi:hypothetical protein